MNYRSRRLNDDSTHPTFALDVRPKHDLTRKYFPVLMSVEGPQRGSRFPLVQLENYIGRSSQVEVVLSDDMASRRHARILYKNYDRPEEPPECYLEDLGSRNGTELNGQVIKGTCRLHERDRILIGASLLGFFLRDDNELEHEQLLYEMATRDALTGLDNRHQFRTHLVHYVERSRRYGRNLSLLIIDVDHFKRINDEHGHDVGDRALIHLARVIDGCCRSTEIPARWGGEEFCILMPESGEDGPMSLGDRIRKSVEQNPLIHSSGTIAMTVSIGGATLRPDEDAESLFRRADHQLFKAKEMGRNRIFLDDETTRAST